MIELIQPYVAIAVKLITGMIGILTFLRITGKTQMGQLTPLDTVSAFVIGALVGGVLYNPDMTIWHLIFALAVWTGFNMLVRFAIHVAPSYKRRKRLPGERRYHQFQEFQAEQP